MWEILPKTQPAKSLLNFSSYIQYCERTRSLLWWCPLQRLLTAKPPKLQSWLEGGNFIFSLFTKINMGDHMDNVTQITWVSQILEPFWAHCKLHLHQLIGSCITWKQQPLKKHFYWVCSAQRFAGPVREGLQLEEKTENTRKGKSRCLKQQWFEMRAKEMEKHRRHP